MASLRRGSNSHLTNGLCSCFPGSRGSRFLMLLCLLVSNSTAEHSLFESFHSDSFLLSGREKVLCSTWNICMQTSSLFHGIKEGSREKRETLPAWYLQYKSIINLRSCKMQRPELSAERQPSTLVFRSPRPPLFFYHHRNNNGAWHFCSDCWNFQNYPDVKRNVDQETYNVKKL